MQINLLETTTTHYIADAIALVIMIVFSVRAAKKGFVGCLFGFVSTIASAVIAFSFAEQVAILTNGFFGLSQMLPSNEATLLVGGVLLFVACKLILRIVRMILTAILDKIVLVGSINRILGFAVGLIESLFFICGALAILSLLQNAQLTLFFSDCILLNYFYNQNPIFTILSWILA
jgi:uncharacterized membrane protein required for colicin V production